MERAERLDPARLRPAVRRAADPDPVGDAGRSPLSPPVQRFVKVWRQADRRAVPGPSTPAGAPAGRRARGTTALHGATRSCRPAASGSRSPPAADPLTPPWHRTRTPPTGPAPPSPARLPAPSLGHARGPRAAPAPPRPSASSGCMVERNLQRVARPGPRGPGRCAGRSSGTFDSYARYWVESFRLPGTSPEELDAGMAFEGFDRIENARATAAPARSWPCPTSAAGSGRRSGWRRPGGTRSPRWSSRWSRRSCSSGSSTSARVLGMNVVPLGPGAGTAVATALKQADIICLALRPRPDRQRRRGRVLRRAHDAAGRAGHPGPAHRRRRSCPPRSTSGATGHHATIRRRRSPPSGRAPCGRTSSAITQDLAYELEELIRAAPEQWHLLQPNWPSDHEAAPRAAARGPAPRRVPPVRIGLVCPYSLTIPGGVQGQVSGWPGPCARRGHEARVLAPCDGPPPDGGVTPLGNERPRRRQRLGGPARPRPVGPAAHHPGPPGRGLRRPPPPRADRPRAVHDGPADQARAAGRHVPRRRRERRLQAHGRPGPAASTGASTCGARCPRTPAAGLQRGLGGTTSCCSTASRWTGLPERRAVADRGPDDLLLRAPRAPQGPGRAARGDGRPARRRAALGRQRRPRDRGAPGPGAGDPRVEWLGRLGDEEKVEPPAGRRRLLRPVAARRVVRRGAARGHGGRDPDRGHRAAGYANVARAGQDAEPRRARATPDGPRRAACCRPGLPPDRRRRPTAGWSALVDRLAVPTAVLDGPACAEPATLELYGRRSCTSRRP